jgi:hypothetical protein
MNLTSPKARLVFWCGVTVFLLAWNGVLAVYANPFLMLQQHDGTQYHLLVRNRLKGHYEMEDSAHTVRAEGENPIWRPALVWIEEPLARWLGSVQASARVASAAGATLLELGLLWLAWICFGPGAAGLVKVSMVLPLAGTCFFMRMAVGQGPESWAAAALVAGMAALALALRRQSWAWAVSAGILAGLAEWFRAGSYLVFLIPAFLYLVRAFWVRERGRGLLPATAMATFVATVFVSGLLVPSRVNKTVVAMTHRLQEQVGVQCYVQLAPDAWARIYMSGLQLCPNLLETNVDYAVNQARDASTLTFVREHFDELAGVYLDGVTGVFTTGFRGLRELTGEPVFYFFVFGILFSLPCRREMDFHALVLAAGALAHYFGPVVLLRGPDVTHYLLVILPFFYVVAAYGVQRLVSTAAAVLKYLFPKYVDNSEQVAWPMLAMGAAPLVCIAVLFYHGALMHVIETYQEAERDRSAVTALNLDGEKVAVRSMAWFEDLDVETVLLPYATAEQLVNYAKANKLDGLLLWEKEDPRYTYFCAMPYPELQHPTYASLKDFHRALEQTGAFDAPRYSGPWSWYPLRTKSGLTRKTGVPPVRAGETPAPRKSGGNNA